MALAVQNVLFNSHQLQATNQPHHRGTPPTPIISLISSMSSPLRTSDPTCSATLDPHQLKRFVNHMNHLESLKTYLSSLSGPNFPASNLPWCYILYSWLSNSSNRHVINVDPGDLTWDECLVQVMDHLLKEKIITPATLVPKPGTQYRNLTDDDLVPLRTALSGHYVYAESTRVLLCGLSHHFPTPAAATEVDVVVPRTTSSIRTRATLDVDALVDLANLDMGKKFAKGVIDWRSGCERVRHSLERLAGPDFPASELPWSCILFKWLAMEMSDELDQFEWNVLRTDAIDYLLEKKIITPDTLVPADECASLFYGLFEYDYIPLSKALYERGNFYATTKLAAALLPHFYDVPILSLQHEDPKLVDDVRWWCGGRRLLVLGNRDPGSPLHRLPDDMIYMIGGMLGPEIDISHL